MGLCNKSSNEDSCCASNTCYIKPSHTRGSLSAVSSRRMKVSVVRRGKTWPNLSADRTRPNNKRWNFKLWYFACRDDALMLQCLTHISFTFPLMLLELLIPSSSSGDHYVRFTAQLWLISCRKSNCGSVVVHRWNPKGCCRIWCLKDWK